MPKTKKVTNPVKDYRPPSELEDCCARLVTIVFKDEATYNEVVWRLSAQDMGAILTNHVQRLMEEVKNTRKEAQIKD